MNVTGSWFACLAALALMFAGAGLASAQVHRANDPPWDGFWLWGPGATDAPALEVDLQAWLAQRPGGWSTALTHRIVGHAATAGLSKVYWHLEDEHGRRLYPSSESDRVLRWPNWGADFSEFDFPASAMAVAERAALPIALVARSQAVYDEATACYPEASIVMVETLAEAGRIRAETMRPSDLARRHIDRRTHWFRRDFETASAVDDALITITAQRSYRLYLNGTLLGTDADWWRGETYDVTAMLDEPGRHVLAVAVEPDDQYAGLLLNMRWREAGTSRTLVTDERWRVTAAEETGWAEPDFDDAHWHAPGIVGYGGIGPRFRLKEPWRNLRPLRSTQHALPVAFVREVQLRAADHDAPPQTLLADAPEQDTRWAVTRLPATLEIHLARPTRLREVRLHSGMPRLREQGLPDGRFEAYEVQSHENGRWVNLVPPVTSAERDARGDDEAAVACHAFSPRQVHRLRLIVREADSPADAAAYLRQIQLLKAFDESIEH